MRDQASQRSNFAIVAKRNPRSSRCAPARSSSRAGVFRVVPLADGLDSTLAMTALVNMGASASCHRLDETGVGTGAGAGTGNAGPLAVP